VDIAKSVNLLILNDLFVSISGLLRHNGHVHDSFDYMIGKCRVIANPRGYARNRLYAESPEQVEWENPGFDPTLVLEV